MAKKPMEFPDIKFWDEKATLINFINPQEFKRSDLLRKLGLKWLPWVDSFGTSDREEILRRQRLIRLFVENLKFTWALNDWNDLGSSVPTRGQAFLDHFNPENKHNPFWKKVNDVCHAFEQARNSGNEIPAEAEELFRFINATKEAQEALETEWADQVAEKIHKAAEFQGMVTIRVENRGYKGQKNSRIVHSSSYGYRLYSYHLSSAYKLWDIKRWMKSKVFSAFRSFFKWINKRKVRRKYTHLFIEGLPQPIRSAINLYINNIFDRFHLKDDEQIELRCYFNYNQEGLRLRIISLDFIQERKTRIGYAPQLSDTFEGFSKTQKRQIARMNKRMQRKAQKLNRLSHRVLAALGFISKKAPNLLGYGSEIKSKEIDLKYQWPTFSGMLADNPDLAEKYSKIDNYRKYITEQFKILKQINSIAIAFINKAEKIGRSLSFPKILGPDEHLFSFEELYPIHLIGRKKRGNGNEQIKAKDIVPIRSLVPLNGQMLAFTGQNASGKTVAEEAIVHEIFCAQSGFPTFGIKVALNPKSKIGMVLLERGDGSTVQLMVEKMARVLKEVKESAQNGSVVVLDEVGTGTNSSAGIAIGQKFLQAFAKAGCSMVFSTQIPELAQFTEEELEAICFNFEFDHTISPGIGTSDADRLIEQLGVDELLR